MTARRIIVFDCEGDTLVGSLDAGEAETGLLIVSGGNEIRAGAHRGMALLAARLSADGVPVFRYDRRGVGDSAGLNRGYTAARDDLLAAVAAFRAAQPAVTRIVGFGNCDAATTLAWWGRDAGLAAVVLANPFTVPPADDLPPAAAIRAHYAAQLRDPAAWWHIARRGISLSKLARGLARLAMPKRTPALADRTLAAIAGWGAEATIVLARHDATAIAYADAARRAGVAPRTATIETGSHSFARAADAAALEAAIRAAI